MNDDAFEEIAVRTQNLVASIESLPDPKMRDQMGDVVQGLMALYGEGLRRIIVAVHNESDGGCSGKVMERLRSDNLVSHLLLLHDLHPETLEQRVAGALETVRPYLKTHGGNVELVGVEDGVAHLRLQGSCSGCPSSTATLKSAIEEAVYKAAPDLVDIQAEGVVPPPSPPGGFIAASTIAVRPKAAVALTGGRNG